MAGGSKVQTRASRATSFKLPRQLVSLVVPLPGLLTGMARALVVPCVGGFGTLPVKNSLNLSTLVSFIFSESISQCFSPSLHSQILGLTFACRGVTSALSGSPTPTVGKSSATHRDEPKAGSAHASTSPNFDQQMALPVRRQLITFGRYNAI